MQCPYRPFPAAPSPPPSTRAFKTNCNSFGRNFSSSVLICSPATCQPLSRTSALPGLASQSSSTSPSASSNPIAQAFNQLTRDLQAGNIAGAQQDFGNLKQDLQKAGQGHDNLRHHVHGFNEGSGQTLTQWGQAPPSANASAAQTAYNSLFQQVQQIGSGDSLTPALQAASLSSDSVSFNA